MSRIALTVLSLVVVAPACKKTATAPQSAAPPLQPPAKIEPGPSPAAGPSGWREGLASKEPEMRRAALRSIPLAPHAKAPAELLGALGDADASVRKAAIDVASAFILRSADPTTLDRLMDLAASDRDPTVRSQAILVAGSSSHRDVVPRLLAIVKGEKDLRIRGDLIAALARSADRRTLNFMRGLLKEKEPPSAVFDALRLIETQATPDLLNLMGHEIGAIRRRAIELTGEIGDASASAKLRQALGDQDPQVVAAAADALARLGGTDAAAELLRLAERTDPKMQAAALRALAAFRKPEAIVAATTVPLVLRLLEQGTEEVRVAAAQVLGSARLQEGIAALRQAAQAKNPTAVRIAALESLGRVGAPAALGVLQDALNDADGSVRASAALTIGRLDAAGRPAASMILERLKNGETHLDARAEMLTALGRIGAVEAVTVLQQVASSDEVPLLRVLAAGALLRMQRPEGAEAIRPLLKGTGHWQERREAARALEARSWTERREAAKSAPGTAFAGSVAQLILDALAAEKEPLVREVLYQQLAKARGPVAAAAQRGALSEVVPFFRLMAAAGLCRNGDSTGCQVIVAALKDPDANVRAEAARRAGWYRVQQARDGLRANLEDPVVFVATASGQALERIEK